MTKKKENSDDKIFAVMAYLLILCIVPLVFKKDSKFVLLHSKQGLVIFVGFVCVFVASILFEWILRPGIFLLGLASIAGIIQSIRGQDIKIPVISGIADKIVF